MPFMLVNTNNNMTILAIIVIFFVFVMPMIEGKFKNEKEKFSNCLKKYLIPVNNKVDTLKCSHKCCNHIQWPIPHIKKNKHLATNIMCNRGNGSGCVCMNKKVFNNLSRRGGNTL